MTFEQKLHFTAMLINHKQKLMVSLNKKIMIKSNSLLKKQKKSNGLMLYTMTELVLIIYVLLYYIKIN